MVRNGPLVFLFQTWPRGIGPHLSILCENGCRSEICHTTGYTCDLWNIRIRPIPVYEWSDLDKCGGWIWSSLTCYALKYSWFGGLTHWGQTWREEKLARRSTFPRWRSAFWQRRHIKGTPFTNAMLCKTEQAKKILHTFSWVYSSVPPAGPRRSHRPFSEAAPLWPMCVYVHYWICVPAL